MGGYGGQYLYRKTFEARGAILNPPARELTIEKVSKYGMRKPSIRVVV
jgi:hypothetical protein